MVDRYNRAQMVWAIISAIGGMSCCLLAFLFFRYAIPFASRSFGFQLSDSSANLIGLAGLGAAWISGYQIWKRRGGFYSYHESSLYHELDLETAGAMIVDLYAHRVTAPAYLISQIFLSGPLLLLRSLTLMKSRIEKEQGLDERLASTLELLQSAKKWQSLEDYPDLRTEVLYLAQMGLIDFSGHTQPPRIKAA